MKGAKVGVALAVLLAATFVSAGEVTLTGTGTYVVGSGSGFLGFQIGESVYNVPGGTLSAVPLALNGTPLNITSVPPPTGTSLLDIGDNNLVVVNAAATYNVTLSLAYTYTLPNNQFITSAGSVVNGWDVLPAAIVSASNSGLYNGTLGLTSSFVGDGSNTFLGIGYVTNSALAVPYTTFGSDTSVPASALLIAPAYKGDFNLSGTVTLAGYYAWAGGYSTTIRGGIIPQNQLWQNGDYLNEGTVTMDGYVAWANAYEAELNGGLPALRGKRRE